jgi:hypothetical protein
MTNEQIERLRALCDAADQGALREGELQELTGLAREAATAVSSLEDALNHARDLLRELYKAPLKTKREVKSTIDAFFLRHS